MEMNKPFIVHWGTQTLPFPLCCISGLPCYGGNKTSEVCSKLTFFHCTEVICDLVEATVGQQKGERGQSTGSQPLDPGLQAKPVLLQPCGPGV